MLAAVQRAVNREKRCLLADWSDVYCCGLFLWVPILETNMTRQRLERMKADQEINEVEAETYALEQHGFRLTVSRLQQSRAGKCAGPKYIKMDGFHIRYTARFIDECVKANKPRVIDPSGRFAETA